MLEEDLEGSGSGVLLIYTKHEAAIEEGQHEDHDGRVVLMMLGLSVTRARVA